MISVVCWMWNGPLRSFLPEHVNVLGSLVARNLSIPHRFVCVTDSAKGLASHVSWFETPPAARVLGDFASPEGPRFPSCYRRLWSFSEEAKALGDRILVIDIDLVVVGNIDHLFDNSEDFVGWRPYRDWGAKLRYGGGIYLLRTGARRQVWDNFKGRESIAKARAANFRGSDQAWISYQLTMGGKVEKYWGRGSGLYSVRDLNPALDVPSDARLIQFNGGVKPWQSLVPWVKEAWTADPVSHHLPRLPRIAGSIPPGSAKLGP